jgi:hypothetical protein
VIDFDWDLLPLVIYAVVTLVIVLRALNKVLGPNRRTMTRTMSATTVTKATVRPTTE